jgi:hypothetical protein
LLEPTPVYTNRLQCCECGRVSPDNERGWRAHLTAEEDGSEDIAVYCPSATSGSSAIWTEKAEPRGSDRERQAFLGLVAAL